MHITALKSAVPTITDYKKNLQSSSFKTMEAFSDDFLTRNRDILTEYARKWVADPFHQWSRQWEYPYVYNKLFARDTDQGTEFRIMDAGSGVTFFPYYLTKTLDKSELHCVDFNDSYVDMFSGINKTTKHPVNFSIKYLDDTGFEKEYFDAIYCISVLEHTKNYDQIIEEFFNVLKPGGRLILTFDISLDERNDISPDGAADLIGSLTRWFKPDDELLPLKGLLLENDDILTTRYAYGIDPDLLWTSPPPPYKLFLENLKYLLRGKKWASFPPLFTVYCLSLTKK